ncbi:MAG: class I SAM-dependent methyltransferase [Burkholderiales bacterium]
MSISPAAFHTFLALCAVSAAASVARARIPKRPSQPIEGQSGKDAPWVPTPTELVEKMLDLARVTPQDYVIDLGSGDGRNVIAAAKRGARALGVEYSSTMIEISQRIAVMEGVADTAMFVQGDLYEADISQATVLTLFLLPENLRKLTAKFLELRPGTRIVTNRFGMEGWDADETGRLGGDSASCCTALLYIVPANVAGTWRLQYGELKLEQTFQILSGTLTSRGTSAPIQNGRVLGDRISFSVCGTDYAGRVTGAGISGTMKGNATAGWSAVKARCTT